MIVFAAIILVGIGIGCQKQRKKAAVYEKNIQELNTDIQELEETNKTLEEEKQNIDSDSFKEKMARERLGMIGEDEYSLQQSENGRQSETTRSQGEKDTGDSPDGAKDGQNDKKESEEGGEN